MTEKGLLLTNKKYLLTEKGLLLTNKKYLLTEKGLMLANKKHLLTEKGLLLTNKKHLLTEKSLLLTVFSSSLSVFGPIFTVKVSRPLNSSGLRGALRVGYSFLNYVPQSRIIKSSTRADVAELVDAQVSEACCRKAVEVRFFSSAPNKPICEKGCSEISEQPFLMWAKPAPYNTEEDA